ncbi:response regulator transcription factor [Desulfuromonas thiophila]|uniref:response regulator transcription factor n=1 Tax=Desulfuromonas thiophila TaxID=57664 RepID=UPI0029F491D8|nr:response regulator transcription factor [Desulfuromonas thiophila]
MSAARLLLVEDEQHIAAALCFNLRQEGYQVQQVDSGEEALQRLSHETFDLVILDRMLAGELDGLQVCQRIRRIEPQLPILLLTALGEEAQRIAGLAAGADDYLAKPFSLTELLLRIAGMLRRSAWYRPQYNELSRYRFGDAEVNLISGEACRAGQPFQLTDLELRMLKLFISHEGEILSRAFLLKSVWGMAPDTETRTLDNFIVRLRKYFEKKPARPRHFLTVRGRGYRFNPEG